MTELFGKRSLGQADESAVSDEELWNDNDLSSVFAERPLPYWLEEALATDRMASPFYRRPPLPKRMTELFGKRKRVSELFG